MAIIEWKPSTFGELIGQFSVRNPILTSKMGVSYDVDLVAILILLDLELFFLCLLG